MLHQVDEQLPEPRRGIHIDLALHVDDLDAVRGVVTQLQVHMSSSAMPGVISPSIPAPRAGVARPGLILRRIMPRSIIRRIRNVAAAGVGGTRSWAVTVVRGCG